MTSTASQCWSRGGVSALQPIIDASTHPHVDTLAQVRLSKRQAHMYAPHLTITSSQYISQHMQFYKNKETAEGRKHKRYREVVQIVYSSLL